MILQLLSSTDGNNRNNRSITFSAIWNWFLIRQNSVILTQMENYKPGLPFDVTLEIFETVVDQHPHVILDFWAEWCKPCKVFEPAFAIMAELHPQVFFGKVNVEVAKDLAEAFQVRSIPTLMAFKNGELVFEQPGILPAEHFQKLVEKLQEPKLESPE